MDTNLIKTILTAKIMQYGFYIFGVCLIIGIIRIATNKNEKHIRIGKAIIGIGIIVLLLCWLPIILAIPLSIYISYKLIQKKPPEKLKEEYIEENVIKNNIINQNDNEANTEVNDNSQSTDVLISNQENKNDAKPKSKLPIFIVIAVLIGIFIFVINLKNQQNPEHIYETGIKIENNCFKISQDKLAQTLDYAIKTDYDKKFKGTTIKELYPLKYVKNKNGRYYQNKMFKKNSVIVKVYDNSNNESINSMEISYNWDKNNLSKKELTKRNSAFSAYVNSMYMAITGNENFNKEKYDLLWDTLNKIKYKYDTKGYPYGEKTFKDEKAMYTRKESKGNTSIKILPINHEN